jgi:hypothetical protein
LWQEACGDETLITATGDIGSDELRDLCAERRDISAKDGMCVLLLAKCVTTPSDALDGHIYCEFLRQEGVQKTYLSSSKTSTTRVCKSTRCVMGTL